MELDKYPEILEYLTEFVNQKNNPVRNIESNEEEYPEIIWFADLPKHELIESATDTSSNRNPESVIKFIKPKEPRPPAFPKLSEVMELWIIKDSLTDENKGPRLKLSIPVNGKTLLATNYPQIETEFNEYVKNKWLEDFVAYKTHYSKYETRLADYGKLSKAYEKFFSIYNKLLQQEGHSLQTSASLELVAAAGLLYYKKDSDSPLICRHILTSKADILFDPLEKDEFIEIMNDVESVIQIETDSFEDIFREDLTPNPTAKGEDNLISAEKRVYELLNENNITNNLFDIKIKDILTKFARSVNSEIEFIDELNKPIDASTKPVIIYAPAILLRKKNIGGITSVYDKIVKYVDSVKEFINIPSEEEKPYVHIDNESNDFTYLNKNSTDDNLEPNYSLQADSSQDNQIKIDSNPKLLSFPEFLVFTNQQNVYKVQNKVFSNKLQILGSIAFDAGEKPIYLTGTRNYSGYLIVAFENGKIGKITMESYKTEFNRKKLKSAFNNESRLVFIELIDEDIDLVAISNINKVMLFNTRQINPVGSKITKGFQVMKSKDRSFMTKVKKLSQVKFQDIEYYRRNEGLNAVGFYLKQGDEV